VWSGFSWLRIMPMAGCCEYGDEHSDSGATELVTVNYNLHQNCYKYVLLLLNVLKINDIHNR
jgi:hypothetical protein